MFSLGLTGGIGSGKTYIGRMFAALGIPVYDADSRTKTLYADNPELRSRLVALLGEAILTPEGLISPSAMASRIFADKRTLRSVDALVHPAVLADFDTWKLQFAGKGSTVPYVIMESALLLQMSQPPPLDRIATVSAPKKLRIRRVCARDGVSPAQVRQRMRKQITDRRREALADFVIVADGKRALLPRVLAIHREMLHLNDNRDE